jgi:hypothetical protein
MSEMQIHLGFGVASLENLLRVKRQFLKINQHMGFNALTFPAISCPSLQRRSHPEVLASSQTKGARSGNVVGFLYPLAGQVSRPKIQATNLDEAVAQLAERHGQT